MWSTPASLTVYRGALPDNARPARRCTRESAASSYGLRVLQGQPSRTAFAAARLRAVHQILEQGRVFADPLAWTILAEDDEQQIVAAARADPNSRRLRMFIAARHRFAEDRLAAAVARGVDQLVVLGAGLDTFSYRNTYPALTVYEVDHPDTSAWNSSACATPASRSRPPLCS